MKPRLITSLEPGEIVLLRGRPVILTSKDFVLGQLLLAGTDFITKEELDQSFNLTDPVPEVKKARLKFLQRHGALIDVLNIENSHRQLVSMPTDLVLHQFEELMGRPKVPEIIFDVRCFEDHVLKWERAREMLHVEALLLLTNQQAVGVDADVARRDQGTSK